MKLPKILISCLIIMPFQLSIADQAAAFEKIEDPIVQKRLINIKAKFEQLSEEEIKSYQDFKKKAIEANEKQKYFTALIEANDALAIFKDDIDLLWLKGVCHAQLDDLENAVINYEKALAIHPNHAPSLLNIVEVYFYYQQYEKALKYITYIRKYLNSAGVDSAPVFDFKYLIILTKLVKDDPDQYSVELSKLQEKYTYLDDNPFYYYAKALKALDVGDNNEGQVWIHKAAVIFQNAKMIKIWNKALEDSKFLAKHDIFIDIKPKQK